MGDSHKGDNLLTALVAGSTAATVSAALTYPLDSLKTQQQLNNQKYMAKYQIPANTPGTVSQIYKGGSALVIGSFLKNSARLILYNWLTKFMAIDIYDSQGVHRQQTSAPRIVIAGMMSGFLESLWIIPFENVKITMIQNMTLRNELARCGDKQHIKYDITGMTEFNKHHKPAQRIFDKQYVSPHSYFTSELQHQYKSGKPASKFQPHTKQVSKLDALKIQFNKQPTLTFMGTIREIYKLKGVAGFYYGTMITLVRQVAISSAWLSTYNATRQLIDPHGNSEEQSWFGHKHTAFQLIGLHLLSSVAVVASTQPIDVIKSHLQLKNGKYVYTDSLSTAYRLFLEQGYKTFWKGSLPRGIKVAVSGGLTAAIYSYVEKVVDVAVGQTVFAE